MLPPLPGRGTPSPEPEPEPTRPAPTTPTPAAKPAAAKPTPATTSSDAGVVTPEPPATPEPPGTPKPGRNKPDATAPPQPQPLRPPPTGEAKAGEPLELPTDAPAAGPGASFPRLPPPTRPPYRGTGMFIAAGVTFSAALAEQIVAHVLVKRRCTDPVQRRIDEDAANEPTDPTLDADGNGVPDILEIPDEAERAGELVIDCIPGVVPAIALRVHSDIGLLATIGLATAAGLLRARRAAYDDVFGQRAQRQFRAFRIAGLSLVAGGVVTWFATGAGTWGWLAGCDDGRCVTRARLTNFLTRDTSALMIASGGALLGFSEAYRRNFDRFARDRAWSIGPTVGATSVGLTIQGRL